MNALLRLGALLALSILLPGPTTQAIENGEPDGGRHPAVGFIIGTLGDPCSGGQFIGFSGVLIGPDVFLTSADIAFETQRHLDSNFFDTAWVILDPEPLVAPTTPVVLDCTKFIRVVGIFVNPVYQSDPDRNEGDVGVLRLEAPQAVPVADLPAANRLKHFPQREVLTAVAFGRIEDPGQPSGFDLATLRRRSATARTDRPIRGEIHNIDLDPSTTGGPDPCITNVSSGGPAFAGSTNEIVSIARFPSTGCFTQLPFQRLDVPSVRSFLSDFVALP